MRWPRPRTDAGGSFRMMVKLLASTAVAAVLASSALAADSAPRSPVLYAPAPMVTGHVEMGLGVFSAGSTSGLFTASGRANKVLWHGWNMELEAGGNGIFGSPSSATSVFSGYGHFWTMATPVHAFGVFGGAAFTTGTTVTTVGIEGKAHLGALTLGASIADSFPTGGGSNFWTGNLSAAAYLDPNTRIGAAATVASGNGFGSTTVYVLTADAEHRFVDPISMWGSLNYVTATGSGSNAWAGLLGLRIFADPVNSSLRSHDDIVPWHVNNQLRAY